MSAAKPCWSGIFQRRAAKAEGVMRHRLTRLLTVAVALGTTLAAKPLAAQPVMVMPNGTEFQVNTYTSTTSIQFGNGVCHDGQGNFVVVWQSGDAGGSCIPGCPDGDQAGIFGQRYA